MKVILSVAIAVAMTTSALAQSCEGNVITTGNQRALKLADGGIVLRAKMNINIDGSARAYHRDNTAAGGLIHLCNGAEVVLPGGARYHGSESNATCTGKFMRDYERIRRSGWKDPSVGVIRWYGVLGQGSVVVAGQTVRGVVPVEQADGSGFYVSPTTLIDPHFPEDDQKRYVEPLTVPAAVVRNSAELRALGIVGGTTGVAIDARRGTAVPFIVGDTGPRIGEGTPALARLVAGLPVKETITRAERFAGQVDGPHVVWAFFGGAKLPPPYDPVSVRERAGAAFQAWGGEARLRACANEPRVPAN